MLYVDFYFLLLRDAYPTFRRPTEIILASLSLNNDLLTPSISSGDWTAQKTFASCRFTNNGTNKSSCRPYASISHPENVNENDSED